MVVFSLAYGAKLNPDSLKSLNFDPPLVEDWEVLFTSFLQDFSSALLRSPSPSERALMMALAKVGAEENRAALLDYRQGFLRYAQGDFLDYLSPLYGVEGRANTLAKSVVTLTPISGYTRVYEGAVFQDEDGFLYDYTGGGIVFGSLGRWVALPVLARSPEAEGGMPDSVVSGVTPYGSATYSIEATPSTKEGQEEGDEAFRARLQLSAGGRSYAGPKEAYKALSMGADASIQDALVIGALVDYVPPDTEA